MSRRVVHATGITLEVLQFGLLDAQAFRQIAKAFRDEVERLEERRAEYLEKAKRMPTTDYDKEAKVCERRIQAARAVHRLAREAVKHANIVDGN